MGIKIKIVCGPTASGKSAHAIEIAQGADGVIINADAMQVYRELRVLTARPNAEEAAKAQHLLYGVMGVAEACSAAKWLTLAKQAIDDTLAKGKLPVVVGGTGLYLKALMEGLSPIQDVPEKRREEATQLWKQEKEQALATRDPAMASRLKAGDTQRHIRALEVWLATGKSLAYWQEQAREAPYPDAEFDVEKIEVERKELYCRCDARFLAMLEAGALEEAKALQAMKLSPDLPAMRVVGVPELINYLEGKCDLAEATRRAQQATRNYAKRQMTWLRNQLP